ncbi:hypothetical protein NIES2130_39025 [Scytonema sp. HK-05]|nr:hypothetical protein NIES2130_39025 [Scytonema sp. HK-05]
MDCSFTALSFAYSIAVVKQLRTLANLTERLVTAIRSGLCPNQHGSRYILVKIVNKVNKND